MFAADFCIRNTFSKAFVLKNYIQLFRMTKCVSICSSVSEGAVAESGAARNFLANFLISGLALYIGAVV
jgi:hypothetical protein